MSDNSLNTTNNQRLRSAFNSKAYGQSFARGDSKPFGQKIIAIVYETKRGPYDATTLGILAYEGGLI